MLRGAVRRSLSMAAAPASTATAGPGYLALNFDNTAVTRLPLDPEEKNFVRSPVPNACFSLVEPTPVDEPELVAVSLNALALIDVTSDDVEHDDFATYFGGNKVLPGARPAAHCYCGHQFGYFSGQLGDGATMYLGEVVNQQGERWEIQFKGAGKTPYSRTADGRKVLRSSLREFLMSEAANALGIPTTRAGTIVTSSTKVIRDIFYSGNPIEEKATIILRIAPTFLRFGSFEIAKPTDDKTGRAGPSAGNAGIVEELFDYTSEMHFSSIHEKGLDKADEAKEVFAEIVDRTARLVAQWQAVGWCHGVLNTDNMSIIGVTIDYGPYGFMEYTDLDYICNGSDNEGRYSYKNQPEMCKWNCGRLADAWSGFLPTDAADAIIDTFDASFEDEYQTRMAAKLGLSEKQPELVESLVDTMNTTAADWTATFRTLTAVAAAPNDAGAVEEAVTELISLCAPVDALKARYAARLPEEHLDVLALMLERNPTQLRMLGLTPALVEGELANKAARDRLDSTSPDDIAAANRTKWTEWLADYATALAADPAGTSPDERVAAMNAVNPLYVLRNHVAQDAISAAETGDYEPARKLLSILESPYEKHETPCGSVYDRPLQDGEQLVVT